MTDHRTRTDVIIERLFWMALPAGWAVTILAVWLSG